MCISCGSAKTRMEEETLSVILPNKKESRNIHIILQSQDIYDYEQRQENCRCNSRRIRC